MSAGAKPLSGCCSTETRSSTAKALAMYDMPGRETVHCWSRVLSLVDCINEKKSARRYEYTHTLIITE